MKVISHGRETAEVYRYHFDDSRCRWAVFTLCEATGQLSVESDAGAWSYCWSHHGRGSLKAFLAEGDAHYVLGKFRINGGDDLRDRFDEEKSMVNVRDEIIRERRAGRLARAEARRLLDEAVCTGATTLSQWVSGLGDDLCYFLGEPWDFVGETRSPVFELMADRVLPFFFGELRKELERAKQ